MNTNINTPTKPQPNPAETDTLLDDEIPAKFKDPETGALNVDALVKSYKALEQKMGSQTGAPKSPDEYCVDCSHGLFDSDPEVNKRLHEKGFTNEQAQAVYDLAAEKMVPAINALAYDVKAERELEKLINHFGGADKWKEVARQLLAFGQKNMPADVLDNLSSSYEGVLALYRMMQSQEPSLKKEVDTVETSADEQELQSMMRDPKYWKDKDPAFIAKVTEGFKNIYGG